MEFPEDVLQIIRSYARPRMRYIHEYNQIVRLMGVEWTCVKKKLATKDAEHVLDQFSYYADAVIMARLAKEAVPVLAQECTVSDHTQWLIASMNYSDHLEIVRYRLKCLEMLLH